MAGSIWAPEMYFLDGRWYIYTSGQLTVEDGTKHLFVLESESADPFEGFHFKAFLDNTVFGIDPTVFVDDAGAMFICFSQVMNGGQWLSIARLTTPWQMSTPVPISDPGDYMWESLTDGPLNKADNVFAPGHASFFYSPDHTELWIAYHCYYTRNFGATRRMRVCHVQKVDFDESGFPVLGVPLGGETLIPVPAGE